MAVHKLQERRARLMRIQELGQEERGRIHELNMVDDEIERENAELAQMEANNRRS